MILFYAQIKKKKMGHSKQYFMPFKLKRENFKSHLTLPSWMNHTPHKTFVAPFVAENYCKLFLRELRKL